MAVSHCTVIESRLVKVWSNSQRRGAKVQILIYLDLSTILDYKIAKGEFEKLMQILVGDNLSYIFSNI